MKHLGSILVLLFSLSSFADSLKPEDWCTRLDCTDRMKSITADFSTGQLTDISVAPTVASGACYHLNPAFDAEHEHHGIAMLETINGVPTYSGLFSFFATSDPYADLNAEEARQRLTNGGSKPNPGVATEKEHTFEFIQPYSKISYWMRSNPENGETYLLSSWFHRDASPQFIFCRLQKH